MGFDLLIIWTLQIFGWVLPKKALSEDPLKNLQSRDYSNFCKDCQNNLVGNNFPNWFPPKNI